MKICTSIIALVWLASLDLARAQPMPAAFEAALVDRGAHEAHLSRAVEFIVDGQGGHFSLELYQSLITTLQFPEPIQGCDVHNDRDFKIWCQQSTVKLLLHRRNPRSLPASFVVTTSSFTTAFLVNAAETRHQAVSFGIVRQRTDIERFDTAVTREATRLFEAERPVIESAVRRQEALSFAADLQRRHEQLTIEHTPRTENGLSMRITGGTIVGDDLHLFYELRNHGRRPRAIATMKVFNRDAEEDLADLVYMDSPGRQAQERELIAVLERGERTTGSVVVRDVESLAIEPLALGVMGPGGTQPLWIRDIRLAPYILMKPPPEADRASMHVQPSVGLLLLSEELAPSQQTISTTAGLNLRFTFAMMNWSRLAFEGEIAGARASTATFADVSLSGETGELERDTSFLRILGGLRLRFGHDTLLPTVHVAMGLQGTSRSTRLRQNDGSFIPGPSSIGVEVPLMVGIGFEQKLGESWVMGARLSGGTDIGAKTRTEGILELGLHLGYYWDVLR